MEALFQLISPAHAWLFENLVQPLLFSAGFMSYVEEAYSATGDSLLALAEIGLTYAILRPLEAWRPVEQWSNRRGVWPDVLYTFLYRTGALSFLFFLLLAIPLSDLDYLLRDLDYLPPNIEELLPWLGTSPLAALLTYVVIIDFFEYWRHRLQHRFAWWWALHATHHSQRTMSLWTDDRNHVLDGLLESLWLALVAQLIGVSGSQFVFIVFLFRLVESLSHANVRLNFGPMGDRVLVSPLFHRVHHGIGVGHEGNGRARGCNFATLFPIWDVIFGTANYTRVAPPTGIRDQLDGVDYGRSFLDQQIKGCIRLWQALLARDRQSAG